MIICKLYKDSYISLIKLSIPRNEIWLLSNSWNDYGYTVTYDVFIDYKGKPLKIGNVKFGNKSQVNIIQTTYSVSVSDDELLNGLEDGKFSLGSTEYYRTIRQHFSKDEQDDYYNRMRDIAFNIELFNEVETLRITKIALLRAISSLEVREKLHLIASGKQFNLEYEIRIDLLENVSEKNSSLIFQSSDSSHIPQNIYVLIGPNGCGKTFLLKSLYQLFKIKKPLDNSSLDDGTIIVKFNGGCDIKKVLFVSYSAIGEDTENGIETLADNHAPYICIEKSNTENFYSQLILLREDKNRWDYFMEVLVSLHLEVTDKLHELLKIETTGFVDPMIKQEINKIFSETSSGNMVMLYSLVVLIGMVEDGMVLLLDEPENHMHPALLSMMIQVYQRVLFDMNAIGIIATHSPLVLQEVPRDKVTIMNRYAGVSHWRNPEVQTYGSPIHTLYRDVFNTGIKEAGYLKMLQGFIEQNQHMQSNEIRDFFSDDLGDLATSCLESMLYERENLRGNNNK